MAKQSISMDNYRISAALQRQQAEEKLAQGVSRLVAERPQTLERLAEESPYTPVALLYTERDDLTNIYQAIGFLKRFRRYDKEISLVNGISLTASLYMHAENKTEIQVPASQLLNYSVLGIKQEKSLVKKRKK